MKTEVIRLIALLLTDGYKTGHHLQYPDGTTRVVSNWTPRSNKYAPTGCNSVVSFGQQALMRWLHEMFQENFFDLPKDEVCAALKEEMEMYLGTEYDVSHFEALHDLGYLPVKVKAIPEGELVPIRVAMLSIYNTKNEFYWVTNYLETIVSNMLWMPMTSATIARQYKRILSHFADLTNKAGNWIVPFQGHDFSMRGMGGLDATIFSGMGHATSFLGSDSLPVIFGARKYYDAVGPVVHSVNATEHSVMCAGTGIYVKGLDGGWEKYGEAEFQVFKRLITEVYPSGIVSIVSDTWDLWQVLTEYLPRLKDEIMARDGKVVIRPDSGDPVDILCGYNSLEDYELSEKRVDASPSRPSWKGVIELLWDTFGGTISDEGFKVLDEHIGAIYGDSITVDRTIAICERLMRKEFATTNTVLGIGSYTYQYNTRDTFGFAMKATYVEVEVDGEIVGRDIFKDPITDDGTKKSARGLLQVVKDDNGNYVMNDQVTWEEEATGELVCIYEDGKFYNEVTLDEVRSRLDANINKTELELHTA